MKEGKFRFIAQFFNWLDKKYKEQLEAYSRAFEEITGLKADARIYHIEV